MNYAETISEILMIVGLLVVFVNIITEVIKNLIEFKSTQSINIFVTILSIALTVGAFIVYCVVYKINIAWYLIIASIIVGFMVAYAAMFGFDKLLKYFERE